MGDIVNAVLLGLIEGLTEFIPVSSTGHLLLAGHFLGFQSAGKTFEVVIQLGAVLAILTIYGVRVAGLFAGALRGEGRAWRAVVSVTLAFVPAVIVGLVAHDFIKAVLFETPRLIAVMLVLGGVVLLYIDRMAPAPEHHDALRLPFRVSLIIGLFQCLAMVPGVSRSGATIVGALIFRVEKRAAAEFSFLLSLPTMGAAVGYDLFKSREMLDFSAMGEIAVGFAVAFVAAVVVVRWVLDFVSRRGYALFGWWRIIVGAVAFVALSLGY